MTYSNIKLPAELFVDLIQPKGTADTIGIIVSASSTVVASSGSLTLRIPDISGEPGRTENLWTGAPSDFIAEVREYTLPSLPVGRYHFVAIVEFIPDHPNAKQLVLSESLYVDARADRILSSNVSFRQIERLELYAELEKRALTGPHTKLAGKRLTVPYRISTEAANSALVENEMARLRATDPDIARQIMALSSQRAESKVDTEPTIRSRTIPLSSERAVPVPKEFRQ